MYAFLGVLITPYRQEGGASFGAMDMRKYVTKKQLAAYLKVSERTITRYQAEGMPYSVLSAHRNLYEIKKIDEWIKKRKNQLLRS